MTEQRRKLRNLAFRIVAALVGSAIWAFLLGMIGSLTGQPVVGLLAGAGLGAIIGVAHSYGQLGRAVPYMSVFAFFGVILGPACDADPLPSGLWSAALGLFLGITQDLFDLSRSGDE